MTLNTKTSKVIMHKPANLQSPNRQRVLSFTFGAYVTSESLQALAEQANTFLREAENGVAILIDMSATSGIAVTLEQFKAAQNYKWNQKLRYVAVVSSDKLTRLLFHVVFANTPGALHFFNARDDAVRFLSQVHYILTP
jgi:alpha/beta superfamily hydrolase